MKSWVRFFVLGVMSISFILTGCGGGGGDSSPLVPVVPGAPTGVTAVAGPGQARITWDNVAGATSYKLYYSATAGVTKATGTKIDNVASPTVVTPLTNGVPYYFVVTAVNANGESVESGQVSATPIAPSAPAPPADVRAVAGNLMATITWSQVPGAVSYNLYHSATAGVTKATGTPILNVTSPHEVPSLPDNVLHYFVVTAVNANGESAESDEVSAIPTPNPPPTSPSGLTATAGPTQATIGWSPVAGATSYNLYYSTTTGVTKVTGTKIPGVTSPKVVDSLVRGVPYYFVVTAENADGESVDSTQVTATPVAPVPQYAQTDLEGAWNAQVILFGANPGWYRYTALVNSAGNVTIANPSFSSGLTIPTVPAWTITPGTGLDNTAGVVTETGVGSHPTFHAKLASNKIMMVGMSTYAPGTYAIHVFMKQTGVLYDNIDLANKTFGYNRIYTGVSKIWEIGRGSVNASQQLTLTSMEDSTGILTPPPANYTTITVSSTGAVLIPAEPNFLGMMSADKKVIVGTSTDAPPPNAKYSLRVIQVRGQTYSASDLAGQYVAYSYHSTPVSSWARGTWTVTSNSATEVSVNAINIFNSDGSFESTLTPWTQNINAQGEITIAPPAPESSSSHGLLSFNKDMVVLTGNYQNGAYMTILME